MPSLSGVQRCAPRFRADRPEWPVPAYDMRSVMAHLLSDSDYNVWEAQWARTLPYGVCDDVWDTIYSDGYNRLTDAAHYGGLAMSIPDVAYDIRGWNDDFRSLRWYGMGEWYLADW